MTKGLYRRNIHLNRRDGEVRNENNEDYHKLKHKRREIIIPMVNDSRNFFRWIPSIRLLKVGILAEHRISEAKK
jgi:hypothetical protein